MPYDHLSIPLRRFCLLISPFLFLQNPDNYNIRENFVREQGTYRWHGSLSLEPPSHAIVDPLGFPPRRVHAHEPIALVATEALGSCKFPDVNISSLIPSFEAVRARERKVELGFGDVRFFTIGMCFFAAAI